MLALICGREITIDNSGGGHAFDTLMVKPSGYSKANPGVKPNACPFEQPSKPEASNQAASAGNQRSLFSRFHKQSSIDVNAGSLAHDLA